MAPWMSSGLLQAPFDERVRESVRGTSFAQMETLPDALPQLPTVAKKRPRTREERSEHLVLTGSQTSEHSWMHVPDLRQDVLLREKSSVLVALSLVAQVAPLPGVQELSVSVNGDSTRVLVTRPFPTATLILMPMVICFSADCHGICASAQGCGHRGEQRTLFVAIVEDNVSITFLGGATDVQAIRK